MNPSDILYIIRDISTTWTEICTENRIELGCGVVYPAFAKWTFTHYSEGRYWALVMVADGYSNIVPSETMRVAKGKVCVVNVCVDSDGVATMYTGPDHRLYAVVMTSNEFIDAIKNAI